MTKSYKGRRSKGRPSRRISVRSVRRSEPDLPKLARALISLAMAQAEADAEQAAKVATPPFQEEPDSPERPDA